MSESLGTVRPLTAGMRRLLFVASGLVVLAAFQLFVLTDHTDLYFSWTIVPGATAAFLGAGYLASFFLENLAARRAAWVDARHTIPPVLSFTILTEVATIVHIGKFHFHERLVWAGLAAWIWLAIYTLVPIAMILLLPGQLRVRGEDTPRAAPMPRAATPVLGLQAGALAVPGVLLFVDPVRWTWIWPWSLTPLTGRAVAAWLLGTAIGLVAHCPRIIRKLFGFTGAGYFREFQPGRGVAVAREMIRRHVEHLDEDRPLYPDHDRMKALVASGEILETVEQAIGRLS